MNLIFTYTKHNLVTIRLLNIQSFLHSEMKPIKLIIRIKISNPNLPFLIQKIIYLLSINRILLFISKILGGNSNNLRLVEIP